MKVRNAKRVFYTFCLSGERSDKEVQANSLLWGITQFAAAQRRKLGKCSELLVTAGKPLRIRAQPLEKPSNVICLKDNFDYLKHEDWCADLA